MNTRAQQISTPMLLPLVASILTTGIVATLFLAPPARPTLSLGQLFAHATFDLAIAACVHVVTVWTTPPGRCFNEITIVIRPSAERALAGSKVSIKDVALVP